VETISISQRTRFSRPEILWMVGLLAVGEAIGVGVSFATKTSHPELSKAFSGGAATLLFGTLLGGIVSLLVADLDRRRVQRAAQIEYLTNVLADLKAVYDQVDRGRTLIAAHQSAKTYGDEMRIFIKARVKLLQVVRALKFDDRRAVIEPILPAVEMMANYLKDLVDEFQRNYKEISREQSIYEAQMKKALASATAASEPDLPKNLPWDGITALNQVKDLLRTVDNCDPHVASADKSDYCVQFLEPLDATSLRLRDALAGELAGRPLIAHRRY
jgi:hypothetical protein